MLRECDNCGVDCDATGEHYLVREDIWKMIHKPYSRVHRLCIGCIEQRLGRELTHLDFKQGMNDEICYPNKSQRLLSRLIRLEK